MKPTKINIKSNDIPKINIPNRNISKSNKIESKTSKKIQEPITKKIKNAQALYDSSLLDIGLSEYTLKKAIKSIEDWVKTEEDQRNFIMKAEFDEEKRYKLSEQKDIQFQIEQLAKNNINDDLLKYFNCRINRQSNLLEKYKKMREDINEKINEFKKDISELEKQVNQKNINIKLLNKENIRLKISFYFHQIFLSLKK